MANALALSHSNAGIRGISSLLPQSLLSQFTGPYVYNMAETDEEKQAREESEAKAKEEEAKKKKEPEPGSAEARVKDALKARDEAEKKAAEAAAKVKEFEEAEKKRIEDEAKAKGEHEKLATQYASERDAEKAAREAAEDRAKRFEERATQQIKDSLEAITDEEKKKSAEALLANLSIEDQYDRLPEILKLVGQPANAFGGPLPNGNGASTGSLDQKKAKHAELLDKKQKGTLSPAERAEEHRLAVELSKEWKPPTPQVS